MDYLDAHRHTRHTTIGTEDAWLHALSLSLGGGMRVLGWPGSHGLLDVVVIAITIFLVVSPVICLAFAAFPCLSHLAYF